VKTVFFEGQSEETITREKKIEEVSSEETDSIEQVKETTEQLIDGWTLSKKTNPSYAPINEYISLINEDFAQHKVVVCSHLQNLYNSFTLS